MKQTFKTGILGALFLASMQAVQAQPNVAAPTPDEDAADVVSLFSEHYTTTGNGPQPQNWGHGATLTTITGTEDAIIAVNGTCDAIFTTGWSAQNKGTIHVDIWPATDGVFSFGLGSGFDNNATWIDDYEWPTLTANQWNTVEVPVVGFDFPKGKVLRTFPSKVEVTFQVGLAYFKSITANNFLVGVSYLDLQKASSDKATVILRGIPEHVSHIRISPSSIDYLIEEQTIQHKDSIAHD